MLLAPLFARVFRHGDLTLIDALGRTHRFAGPELPGIPPVAIRLHDRSLHWRLPLYPSLMAGEAYMDGTLTVERGSLFDFLSLAAENIARHDRRNPSAVPLWRLTRLVQQYNPVARSQRNAAHHYDLSDDLYAHFLDGDRQYSCAYFARPGMSLEEAQEAKKLHIAAKLLLAPGRKVLDIGSGWGGLALTLARHFGVEVLGITLSREQLESARRKAAAAGLDDRVRFELADYRQIGGQFDRIVSVGMFEHVGVNHYRRFFERIRDMLAPDGVALVHAIGRSEGPGYTNPWIRKHIFPGGYSPALSEVVPSVERAGLWITDIEILRLHYADTLAEWRRRFQARREDVARAAGERFCRMWEFYLAGAETAFRHEGHMVFQMQLAKDIRAVPLTRDYMAEAERMLAAAHEGMAAGCAD
ncbi:MAG: cyclopropane-fatty-acyl-phospholipid synthase [Magnetospirillum sp.]|nr:cyclopropane-fatty-acyl-phospholipid synthase [Magnetospirillum sp.]